MATERQILANRLNALRSRGPKTQAGRETSRRNALKHGLTARCLIIEGEDADAFDALRAELFHAYRPQGIVEAQLVDLMAGILWRLRRVPALEAAAFSWMHRCHRSRPLAHLIETQDPDEEREENETGAVDEPSERRKQALGRAVFHLIRDGDLLDKLNRYETQLMNQLARVAS